MRIPRHCCDCRDGEHDNYDDRVELVIVRNLGTGVLIKRGYLCGDHQTMYLDDGYSVILAHKPRKKI